MDEFPLDSNFILTKTDSVSVDESWKLVWE